VSQGAGVACGSESRFIAPVEMVVQASAAGALTRCARGTRLACPATARVQPGGGAGGAASPAAGGLGGSVCAGACRGFGGVDGPV